MQKLQIILLQTGKKNVEGRIFLTLSSQGALKNVSAKS